MAMLAAVGGNEPSSAAAQQQRAGGADAGGTGPAAPGAAVGELVQQVQRGQADYLQAVKELRALLASAQTAEQKAPEQTAAGGRPNPGVEQLQAEVQRLKAQLAAKDSMLQRVVQDIQGMQRDMSVWVAEVDNP